MRSYAALCLVAKGWVCYSAFCGCFAVLGQRSCAAFGCGSSLVAASGVQGGIGGLRFPAPHCAHTRPVFRAAARQPHSSRAARDLRGPSLDSPLPLETPPLRYGDRGGGAARSCAARCRWGKGCGCCFAFLRCFAGFAALPCAAYGCGSSLVAASGGQGGPGGLRFPPRPSLDSPLPFETPPLR